MTVSELIEELAQYDPDLPVGVVVSYTEHCSSCGEGEGYCYCSSEDHEFSVDSVAKQEDSKGNIKGVWIRGDY